MLFRGSAQGHPRLPRPQRQRHGPRRGWRVHRLWCHSALM